MELNGFNIIRMLCITNKLCVPPDDETPW